MRNAAAAVVSGRDDRPNQVVPRARLRRDLDPSARRQLARFAGSSAAAATVRDSIARYAASEASVLVHGASGTGKELAARLVHDLSARAAGPFVALDCGAVAESVLESELFGHARGAFTSAAVERRGLFEEADGGTLFLDEIANTSLSFQARLLRVLQEREVRRVGANTSRRVAVRIISATNRDLATEVIGGRFREDLLYRLDVLQLSLPPLAERREDVEVLARLVLAGLAERLGRPLDIAPQALLALMTHDWPGNVRELQNALERATAHCEDDCLAVEHLPRGIASAFVETRGLDSHGTRLADLLDSFERTVLRARLESNRWNRTRTASELGVTRRCLFNKILRHGLRPD